MVLQNHTWEKHPLKMQDMLVDFNITEYKMFINMVPDATMQLNFKKLPCIMS